MDIIKSMAICLASLCITQYAWAENTGQLGNTTSLNSIVLAELQQTPDNPADIPEAPPTAAGTDHELDPAILALVGDPEYGEYLSSECTSCHLTNGDYQGIPDIVGWDAEDFVITLHAYKNNERIHPVMQMMAGRLSNDEIAALAVYFENLGE